MAKPSSSVLPTLTNYLKKPWEITGPRVSPEYLPAIPKAVEWRIPSPATTAIKPCVPTSLAETVHDIKCFSRDQRRNRFPIRKILLRKDDVLKMMSERKEFSPEEFPPVYLTDKVEEDQDAIGGGYQKSMMVLVGVMELWQYLNGAPSDSALSSLLGEFFQAKAEQ